MLTVENILNQLTIPFDKVALGEVALPGPLSAEAMRRVESELHKVGFEVIETRVNKIIEDIKGLAREYINLDPEQPKVKLSQFITDRLHYDYSYLSDLFSSIEGKTIEQFFIGQRIEKVKELLVYDQLSLTEIAYQTGFSSVHHLSAQFKKVTGLTPSHFKRVGAARRKAIDEA